MQKPVLVLDLDETLISSTFECRKDDCPHSHIRTSTGYRYMVHTRPHLDEFLNYCDQFDIVIFSAASTEYVQKVSQIIFLERKNQPIKLIDAEHLVYDSDRLSYTKRLDIVTKMVGERPMLAIDDCLENFTHDKVIHLRPWNGENDDQELLNIIPQIETFIFDIVKIE